MARRVAIVGAALSDVGRVDHKSAFELHHQATSRALADAGIHRDEIDGFMSHGTGALPPIELAEYLGIAHHVDYIDSTGVGGSCWEIFLEHAVAAIAQGQVDCVVLSYGSTSRADLKRRQRTANLFFGNKGPIQFDAPFGHTLIAKHAMSARRHMHEFGTTIEQLAEIAVSARYNAQFNPDAYYRDPITIADVMNARMIAYPFTLLMCCLVTDGGGALILTSAERAKDFPQKPVYVLGTGESVETPMVSQMEDFTSSKAFRVSGKKAFEEAGIAHKDVDHLMIYDAFAHLPLYGLEDLGFCKPGEAAAFIRERHTAIENAGKPGSLPLNTNGGGLSYMHSGMYGMYAMQESIRQMRGVAPAQVPGAKISISHGVGGMFGASGTVIWTNEAP